VAYVLQVVPSRDIITKYKETKEAIEGLVSRINGKYGSMHWTPVIYQYKSLEFRKMIALYLAADVALITPMRDGMNLVAKEFIASRTDKRGVLILSETAGASAELGEALLVNPTDRQEIAHAIEQALAMPVEEQMSRIEVMQTRIKEYDVVKWAADFLSQLHFTKLKQEELKVKEINSSIAERIKEAYTRSDKRLILLDYDGTLTPLASLPHLAFPKQDLLHFLNELTSDQRNEVVIISGRPMDTLEKWFGTLPVNLVAEHGAFYKRTGTDWLQTIPVIASWKSPVRQVLDLFTERCQGAFVEEKVLSLAWHYRNSEAELGFLRSRELVNALIEISSHLNFQIIEGKKVIEVRARGIDKGVAAAIWINDRHHDFILGIGDDSTDEDLFAAIPAGQHSIRVGLIQSIAKYNLRQQKDVVSLLKNIVAQQENV
jgi:trehalose 6-phosphate synthase/phosphatase